MSAVEHDGPLRVRAALPVQAVVVAVVLLLVAAVAAIGLAFAATHSDSRTLPVPAEGSAEVGFARDMQAHHAQAVTMATIIRDRTSDPQLRTLALDIMLTQQQQIGQMYGWLAAWGLPQTSSDPPMAWMGGAAGANSGSGMGGMGAAGSTAAPASPSTSASMPGPTGSMPPSGSMSMASSGSMGSTPASGTGRGVAMMPGMATAADLRRLAQLPDDQAQRLFLQLMIRHHQGGVLMARGALRQVSLPQVRRLARTIVAAQTAEIRAFRDMLAARGGQLPG